ncbi:hypothetical protein JCM8097_008331 [Rhodosporidiobolus ruineniae]
MRLSDAAVLTAATLLANAAAVFAQSSSASSASRSSASGTATSSSAAASSTTIKTTVSLPPLYECSSSTWTYTGPVGQKWLGIFKSGTSEWVEQYPLPDAYHDRTNGTFTWNCDLPAGLAIGAQFWVVEDGESSPGGNQATTTDAIVNAGSSGSSCLGTNVEGYQAGNLSLASSLDPSFTYTSDGASSTGSSSSGGGGGGSTNVGAIVGGVVGGVCGIAIIALGLVYLKRKHEQAVANSGDGLSLYSGRSEKHNSRYGGGPGSTAGMAAPPPGTYYAHDEQGNTILMMGYPNAHEVNHPYTPPVTGEQAPSSFEPMSPQPKLTAAPGTLPEPMDDSAPTVSSPSRPSAASPPVAPSTPTRSGSGTATDFASAPTTPFTPRSERDAFLTSSHHGLDDPESFSPSRNRS